MFSPKLSAERALLSYSALLKYSHSRNRDAQTRKTYQAQCDSILRDVHQLCARHANMLTLLHDRIQTTMSSFQLQTPSCSSSYSSNDDDTIFRHNSRTAQLLFSVLSTFPAHVETAHNAIFVLNQTVHHVGVTAAQFHEDGYEVL